MNLFRAIGDGLHLLSFFVILYMMLKNNTCAGLSRKTQILYAAVFLTRYVDLPFYFLSWYLTIGKLLFISLSLYIVYLMCYPYKGSYDSHKDTFPWKWLFVFAVVMGLSFNHGTDIEDLLYAFSLWLESVAVLPQLWMIQNQGGTRDVLTYHYLLCLGGYRVFYIMNWAYRYIVEGRMLIIQWVAGVIQAVFFADLFFHYFTKVAKGGKLDVESFSNEVV